jgi:dodecin
MSEHIYQTIDVTGSSASGIQAAIENAIRHTAAQHGSLRWFEVTETRGQIDKGVVAHWQVSLKIGLPLHPPKIADADRPA